MFGLQWPSRDMQITHKYAQLYLKVRSRDRGE